MSYEPKILGILGGGQLGRMTAMAAARLGIRCIIYCPEQDSPASQVAAGCFIAEYDDKQSLAAFAERVDAITYEFENIPVETIRFLQKLKPVCPDDRILEVAQHRIREKKFLNDIGIATTRWAEVKKPAEIEKIAQEWNAKALILKTCRFGYDGKGQIKWHTGDDSKVCWKELNSDEIIAEEIIDFTCEISVIIARDKLGQMAHYGPVLNQHKNGILAQSTAPAPIPAELADKAITMTRLLAEAVDLVGVLALELFVTKDGQILANEIAPRPHNSGHWSIDACAVSQFEQQARTVCGMTVGIPAQHSEAIMLNLIGSDVKKLAKYYEMKNACVHLYGKHDIKEGRKMGHVTILKDKNAVEEKKDDNDKTGKSSTLIRHAG